MDLRIVKTKRKLQKSLIQLLREKSILDISVSELCRTASVDRNTFYSHYDNISDLKNEMLDNYMKEVTEQIRQKAPSFSMEELLVETCRLIYNHHGLTELLYQNLLGTTDLLDMINTCNSVVLPLLAAAHPNVDGEKLSIANRFATGGATLLIIDWFRSGMREKPEIVAKKIAQLSNVLYGSLFSAPTIENEKAAEPAVH